MNKSELIDKVAASADIPKAVAGRALDAVIESITTALQEGDSVVLVGFGTLLLRIALHVLAVTLKQTQLKSQQQKFLALKQVKH